MFPCTKMSRGVQGILSYTYTKQVRVQRSGIQWDSDKLTVDTTNESQEVSPFPAGESLKPNAINHWLVAVRSHLFHIIINVCYAFPAFLDH